MTSTASKYTTTRRTLPDGKVSPAEPEPVRQCQDVDCVGRLLRKGPGMAPTAPTSKRPNGTSPLAFIIEYSAVGELVVLLLYLWLFFGRYRYSKKCGTAFPSLLVLGLGLMIVLQAIHMLVSVSLFPVTGQQLPLISRAARRSSSPSRHWG